jgi:hypothetical protein
VSESLFSGHESPISGHESPISGHESPISGHESPISGHESPISGHESLFSGHESRFSGHESRFFTRFSRNLLGCEGLLKKATLFQYNVFLRGLTSRQTPLFLRFFVLSLAGDAPKEGVFI